MSDEFRALYTYALGILIGLSVMLIILIVVMSR